MYNIYDNIFQRNSNVNRHRRGNGTKTFEFLNIEVNPVTPPNQGSTNFPSETTTVSGISMPEVPAEPAAGLNTNVN